MRRITLLFVLLIVSITFISGTTEETLQSIPSFNITAYKTAPAPVCDVKISSSTSQGYEYSYSGNNNSDGTFDVTGMLRGSTTISDAVVIKMITNRRTPTLKVQVTLKPFVATNNPNKSVSTTYDLAYSSSSVTCTYNSVNYRYTASLSSSDFGSGAVTLSGSESKTFTLTCGVSSNPSLPTASGSTLPGIVDNVFLEPVCKIKMKIANFGNFTRRVEYKAEIVISILSVT